MTTLIGVYRNDASVPKTGDNPCCVLSTYVTLLTYLLTYTHARYELTARKYTKSDSFYTYVKTAAISLMNHPPDNTHVRLSHKMSYHGN